MRGLGNCGVKGGAAMFEHLSKLGLAVWCGCGEGREVKLIGVDIKHGWEIRKTSSKAGECNKVGEVWRLGHIGEAAMMVVEDRVEERWVRLYTIHGTLALNLATLILG
jgi:hypothetical protein